MDRAREILDGHIGNLINDARYSKAQAAVTEVELAVAVESVVRTAIAEERAALSAYIEKLEEALLPFAYAADAMHYVGRGAFPVDSEASIFTGYDEDGDFVEVTVGHFRAAATAIERSEHLSEGGGGG